MAASRTPSPASDPDVSPDMSALVLRQFRVVFNEVKTHFQQVEKQAGLGGAQIWALSLVEQQPGIGVTELSQSMDIHQSTASNLVRHLLKRGLIRSEKSSVDRRSVHLYTLPEATAVLERVPGPYEGVLPDALRKLPDQTLQELHAHLNHLLQVLQADVAAARKPLADL
ncbi:MAG TPA: MarR family winged helix-turn-helix transcriptional regulator [Aquabacterium sp.]|nr:MarR family winged helix-turn-helix transcriptional regulator [Aquabacterium sp.]